MNKTIKISEVYQPRSSRIIDINIKKPKVNEILIKVKACGICGSEYFSWNNADNPPIYLGHEASGEVICVGKGVLGFKPGDNVTGLFRDSFAEYSVIDSSFVMKFPKTLRFDEAALGEPISCVISGALRTEVGLGKTIVVIGLGFMGLMVLQLMRLKGAYKIIAIDTRKEMSELAKHYGADEFYTPEGVPEKYILMDYKGKNGVDIVIECTGKEEALILKKNQMDI
jgi:threonine dehydrogenase-like Zn-dependent dehydrogenase